MELLSAEEVAQILNVTAHHVRHLARTGALPHQRVGRSYAFLKQDVEMYARQRAQELQDEARAILNSLEDEDFRQSIALTPAAA